MGQALDLEKNRAAIFSGPKFREENTPPGTTVPVIGKQ